jgi:hypothetical protein
LKGGKTLRALAGAGLCALGLLFGIALPYQSHTFRIDAGGCRLVTDIVEPSNQPPGDNPQGYVVLFHGLSANKRIMSFITAGFASQGLRVFVPDLPGHGRTPGPFAYERSEQCGQNLVRELTARGLLDPEKTILAGHSLGGAIALRVASSVPVAGVIAFSPAPMRPLRNIAPEMMPFRGFGALPPHSLVMSASGDPSQIRDGSRDLVPVPGDGTSQYVVIPHSSHTSILFDPKAVANSQKWAVSVLHLPSQPLPPSRRGLLGFAAGFVGILLLTGPFLRETLQSKKPEAAAPEASVAAGKVRALLEYALLSLGIVGVLSYIIPLRTLCLFEGDYFASFLLLLGVVLLALHWNALRDVFGPRTSTGQLTRSVTFTLLAAAFTGLLLLFLITAWIDLTFSEAWLTASRWARFAPLLIALLPYHAAEELLLGPAAPSDSAVPNTPSKGWRRLLTALAFRAVAWVALVAGVFFLHSGEVLLVLLAPSFFLFCVFQIWGMKIVREVTASPAAAALFGAILLAGFCLVVFPTT